jgi:hypothetical protein
MGFLISSCSALGTFYPDANPALQGRDLYKQNPELCHQLIYRVLGKLPTLAAHAYRHRMGRAYNEPATGAEAVTLGYSGNFLQMLDRLSESNYQPNPRIVEAMEKLFISMFVFSFFFLFWLTQISFSSCGTWHECLDYRPAPCLQLRNRLVELHFQCLCVIIWSLTWRCKSSTFIIIIFGLEDL